MMLSNKNNVPIVLASASPRRKELLAQLGVEFTVAPASIDESVNVGEGAVEYVGRMAAEKAQAGYTEALGLYGQEPLVIGADTAVVLGDRILGKPADRDDALAMLELLSGQTHRVLSGVAITDGRSVESRISETLVSFRDLAPAERQEYWRSGEPIDKAGAYAIQGLGALFVKEITGSYTGVVGLPLFETAELLALFGIAPELESA
jgi:septum formation protein